MLPILQVIDKNVIDKCCRTLSGEGVEKMSDIEMIKVDAYSLPFNTWEFTPLAGGQGG